MPTGGQADGGLSNVPMHLADISTDLNAQEVNSILMEHEHRLMEEVSAALARLNNHIYGSCEACGQTISEPRLQAIPYARHCIKCASEPDQQSRLRMDQDRRLFDADRASSVERRRRRKSRNRQDETSRSRELADQNSDIHAAGTAGGGTAVGGLAGTNIGHGDPRHHDLERAMGSGEFDAHDRTDFRDIRNRTGKGLRSSATRRRESEIRDDHPIGKEETRATQKPSRKRAK